LKSALKKTAAQRSRFGDMGGILSSRREVLLLIKDTKAYCLFYRSPLFVSLARVF
jgi:hypothetical protein